MLQVGHAVRSRDPFKARFIALGRANGMAKHDYGTENQHP
jgi:hypothetical protein